MAHRYHKHFISTGPVGHKMPMVPVGLALINLVTGMHEGSMLPPV